MLGEYAKAAASDCLQDSQSHVARTLRVSIPGGTQISVVMRFGGRMPGAGCAPLLRLSSAHGTAH
jgi:hypothetical protein